MCLEPSWQHITTHEYTLQSLTYVYRSSEGALYISDTFIKHAHTLKWLVHIYYPALSLLLTLTRTGPSISFAPKGQEGETAISRFSIVVEHFGQKPHS
jgi:hypothetical protein